MKFFRKDRRFPFGLQASLLEFLQFLAAMLKFFCGYH